VDTILEVALTVVLGAFIAVVFYRRWNDDE
jgi:hypothetical protein